jgi:hypothetical protein
LTTLEKPRVKALNPLSGCVLFHRVTTLFYIHSMISISIRKDKARNSWAGLVAGKGKVFAFFSSFSLECKF